MKAYSFNADTGAYEGEVVCQPSPLEKDVFLIPAHATLIDPTDYAVNTIPVFTKENKWEILPDLRKKKFWNKKTKQQVVIKNIGEEPTNELTTKAPIQDTADNRFACVYSEAKQDWEISSSKVQELKDNKKKDLRRQMFETKMKIDKAKEYKMEDIQQEEEARLVDIDNQMTDIENK